MSSGIPAPSWACRWGCTRGANHPFDQGLLDYLPGLRNCRATVSFVMGSMLACTGFIMGGVLERHPQLKLVFLESGCGWAAFWLDRLEVPRPAIFDKYKN